MCSIADLITPLSAGAFPGFRAVFTDRVGGVSAAPFDTFNLSYDVGDNPASVRRNRALLAREISVAPDSLFSCKQVHGSDVHVVGAGERLEARVEADALVSVEAGVALMVVVADCVPVLIIDPERGASAAIHAGRRGLIGGVIPAALAKMTVAFGSDPLAMRAFIGPCIRKCCYQVDAATAAQFSQVFPDHVVVAHGRAPLLDMPGAAFWALVQAGVPRDNNEDTGLCTYSQPEAFFSYRRAITTGRQAAVVVKK